MKGIKAGNFGIKRLGKKKLVIIISALVTLGIVAFFLFDGLRKDKIITEIDGVPVVYVDGQPRKAVFKTLPQADDQPEQTYEQQLKAFLKAHEGKPYTSEDYLALAQLYSGIGDNENAIKNYELAKKTANPKDPNYANFIAAIDKIIKSLRADQ